MHCQKCGARIRFGPRFCIDCGATLPVACGFCSLMNTADANYCTGCGKALASPARRAKTGDAALCRPQRIDGTDPRGKQSKREGFLRRFDRS
jgi:hypothetical protein